MDLVGFQNALQDLCRRASTSLDERRPAESHQPDCSLTLSLLSNFLSPLVNRGAQWLKVNV